MIREKTKEDWIIPEEEVKKSYEFYDIPGYEGYYKINKLGLVWSCRKNKVLKSTINHRGYERIGLTKNRKQIIYSVHRILCFVLYRNQKPEVNHINEIKLDNFYRNLEWATRFDNSNYGNAHSRISKSKTIRVYASDEHEEFILSSASECVDFGFQKVGIGLCCNGKVKTYKGYKWEKSPLGTKSISL